MCRHLQVAHRRVTTAVTLVRTLTSIAGSTSWRGQLLSDGVLSRSPLTPRGPSARRLELGPPLLLARLVLAAGQCPARPALGRGPWRALGTRVTGLGRTLRGSAWGHRYALAARTGDGPMDAVTGKGVLGAQRPAAWPAHGQGRAIISTPCSAHGPTRGLALSPEARSSCSTPGGRAHASANPATAACAGSCAGRTTTSRVTVRSRASAKGSVPPLQVLALLVRPWRRAWSSMETRLAGAPCGFRRGPPGPPVGSGSVACATIWATGSSPSCSRGAGPERPGGGASHRCPRATASKTTRSACSRVVGCPPSRSRAALRRRWPPRLPPASPPIVSVDVPRAWAAPPPAVRRAGPSRCKVSATRPAPHSGGEARAARNCLEPHPPLFAPHVDVRSSQVVARWCAMSRLRPCHTVPRLPGGCAAPRPSSPLCPRLSLTVRATASRSLPWP